jgi:hypothetical protein
MALDAIAAAIAAALAAAALAASGGATGAGSGVGLQVLTLATPAGTSIEVAAGVAAGSRCAIDVRRDGHRYRSRALRPKRAHDGVARWRWTVPPPGGNFTIEVRCGDAGSAAATIAVWSAAGPV